MSANLVLVVDDDETFVQVMARSLRRKGYDAITAHSVAKARDLLTRFTPDMAIVDLKMPRESGLQLIPELKAFNQNINIVVLTGYASIATAVEAMRRGARDYLCKPANTQQILLALAGQSPPSQDIPDTPISVNRLEWEYIQKVLQEHDGNISATARSLGMHRRTLQRKLAKHPSN